MNTICLLSLLIVNLGILLPAAFGPQVVTLLFWLPALQIPWENLGELLPALFGPQVMTLLALIFAQVLLAVAVAIQKNQFEWKKLPDFYRTMVIPQLIGWVALSALAKLAAPAVLGAEYGGITAEGVAWFAWLAVVGSLVARILASARELYGDSFPPIQQ